MLTMDHTILPATRVVIPKDMGHVCQHSPATEHYCSLAKGKRLQWLSPKIGDMSVNTPQIHSITAVWLRVKGYAATLSWVTYPGGLLSEHQK